MSTIEIDELPVASEGTQGRPAAVEVATEPPSRREFIGNVVKGATFVGLAGLTLFRSARRAGAENPPWNEFTGCGPYDPGTVGRDYPCHDNMCIGTTLELMDNGMCTNDCAQVDANNPYQWHRNKTYDAYTYRDYPGDICAAHDTLPARDAWRWSVGRCGFCSPSVYRCHDGEKRTNPSGEWQFTICEGLATCTGAPVTC
jgi:hypothetical protein